jgi:plastocyanin
MRSRLTLRFVVLVLLPAVASFAALPALARNVEVTVVDREGQPVAGVAVYLESAELARQRAPETARAVMDQVDERFVPHILVVQSGTLVDFPNSDTIAHHVYSFSYPNQFKLPIYKGDAYPPIRFDDSGVVILGCNIHDNMLGYILVVDTPAFAMTGPDGHATFDVDLTDDAQLSLWSPRIRDDLAGLSATVRASDARPTLTVQLSKSLRAPHDQQSETLSWSDY